MICTLTLAVGLAAKQRRLAGKLIRLHVVASSDAPDDQARKLLVRDAVLPVAAALTDGCADADAARRRLAAGLPELETAARSALRSAGSDEPVRVSLGSELFPRRDYPTFSLPAGPYTALRVTVGAGSGHNWWCVAFPALCLPATTEGLADAAKTAGLTGDEVDLITGDSAPVRLRFRALDWLAELFG
jgi:stage II sporulation protein R